jgi:protein pelota
MQLRNQEHSLFELYIENLDDLWILSQVISPGDKVFAKTQRKVAIGNDKKKQVTKIISITLVVSKVQFHSQVLRVSGSIENETEFTAVGQSHTLQFSVGDCISLEKKQFLSFQKKLLDKSLAYKGNKALLLVLDKDELIAVELGDFSYSVLFSEKNLGSKKGYSEQHVNDYEEKYLYVKHLLEKGYGQIILAGPAHFKDEFKKFLSQKGFKAVTFYWNDVSTSSLQDLIQAITESKLLQDNQIAFEKEILSSLLSAIHKNLPHSYSLASVKEAISMGSCSNILLSTSLLDKLKESNELVDFYALLEQAEQIGAEIHIISSDHDAGKHLDGLGSIASLNRF